MTREIPPPPSSEPGQDPPLLLTKPPGPLSQALWERHLRVSGNGGPASSSSTGGTPPRAPQIVLSRGRGSNLFCADQNRYVDLAAGFGALLLGHCHPSVVQALEYQATRLTQALGDVYPSEPKVVLMERLAKLYPEAGAQVMLGQSGADAITAALKTAALYTRKPGILAFGGAYHGLSYGPLAACGLRASYREPFAEQLNAHIEFLDYPATDTELEPVLERARFALASGRFGAILVEPVLGRGGVVIPPSSFIPELSRVAHKSGTLVIADEIWTGLGRTGHWLYSVTDGTVPDILCLGKGLGGGVPISAIVGRGSVMASWQGEPEVVHTATFSGAPLACMAALATLDTLEQQELPQRAQEVGERTLKSLRKVLLGMPGIKAVRGVGLMIGVELEGRAKSAVQLQKLLLERGYIVSTGGGQRQVLVLTPPLNISEALLLGFVAEFTHCLHAQAP